MMNKMERGVQQAQMGREKKRQVLFVVFVDGE